MEVREKSCNDGEFPRNMGKQSERERGEREREGGYIRELFLEGNGWEKKKGDITCNAHD